MVESEQDKSIYRPAGYAALIERYDLAVIPNWHESIVTASGIHRLDSREGVIEEVYPSKYWPGDTLGDHLEFALKYDGTNLAILSVLFQEAGEEDLLEYVRSKPTGKYARRLWFLYEFLTGKTLPLDDLKRGNYIDLADLMDGLAAAHERMNTGGLNHRGHAAGVHALVGGCQTVHKVRQVDVVPPLQVIQRKRFAGRELVQKPQTPGILAGRFGPDIFKEILLPCLRRVRRGRQAEKRLLQSCGPKPSVPRKYRLELMPSFGHTRRISGLQQRKPSASARFIPLQPAGATHMVPPCLLYTSPSPRDGLLSRMPS